MSYLQKCTALGVRSVACFFCPGKESSSPVCQSEMRVVKEGLYPKVNFIFFKICTAMHISQKASFCLDTTIWFQFLHVCYFTTMVKYYFLSVLFTLNLHIYKYSAHSALHYIHGSIYSENLPFPSKRINTLDSPFPFCAQSSPLSPMCHI